MCLFSSGSLETHRGRRRAKKILENLQWLLPAACVATIKFCFLNPCVKVAGPSRRASREKVKGQWIEAGVYNTTSILRWW